MNVVMWLMEGARRSFRLGACDYLLKPVNEAELGVKLVRALKVGSRGEAPRQAAPTIPEKIGPWVLVDCIGRGGTACVFTATRPPSDAQYALKLIWPHLTENTETLLRFRREIDTLSTLLHPGLVRFIESGRHEEFFYYAMSYLPGGTLRARIRRRGPHAPAETLQIVRGIAEPLGYLHDRGLVHRDVKPGNVFFDQDDHVVLGDFGLAKRLLDKGITLSEEFVGTPLYLAPEVFRSDRFDQTVDFYAMGVCAYEMLLGRAVIDEPDSMRLIGRIMNEGLPPPATQLSPEKTDTPAELVGLIARLIDPDPTQRPQNAQEVLDALDALGS